ncbi:MAG TPA: FGGY family carbohydrate kinase [Flavitalea sp.]|nr:FGGY family carbohydrate kinase [Flavitalea sp.]
MSALPVIAVFDVGKTNKKIFLFDEQYAIVEERSVQFPEIADEDGDPCEDLDQLTDWTLSSLRELSTLGAFEVKAINFSAYGASLVHLDAEGKPMLPLYNYLKPYPADLQRRFYEDYGGETVMSMHTASPALGSLNSGMQLYRLKQERKDIFDKIDCSLHLPQYLSYLAAGVKYSDITSIGCHTLLWDFSNHRYHEWVRREGIIQKLAPIFPSDEAIRLTGNEPARIAGVGLHDSSAALIPYLAGFEEPFVLISTGTWCISLNPFNPSYPNAEELKQDCLCYLTYTGKNVKASRLFAGYEHEQQVKKLADYFHLPPHYYETVAYDRSLAERLGKQFPPIKMKEGAGPGVSGFGERTLSSFNNYEEAYHQLMIDIVRQQVVSTKLIMPNDSVKKIFVDGGFSRNALFMHLLSLSFPGIEVYAAGIPQATAIGAALAIHKCWRGNALPDNIIELKLYPGF